MIPATIPSGPPAAAISNILLLLQSVRATTTAKVTAASAIYTLVAACIDQLKNARSYKLIYTISGGDHESFARGDSVERR